MQGKNAKILFCLEGKFLPNQFVLRNENWKPRYHFFCSPDVCLANIIGGDSPHWTLVPPFKKIMSPSSSPWSPSCPKFFLRILSIFSSYFFIFNSFHKWYCRFLPNKGQNCTIKPFIYKLLAYLRSLQMLSQILHNSPRPFKPYNFFLFEMFPIIHYFVSQIFCLECKVNLSLL